jgi:sugar lactone lactonase YvrE
MDVRCVVAAEDQLGEGPCWSARDNRLYWFDINGRRLAWYEPATQVRGAFGLPMKASVAALRAAGGLVLVTEKGLVACDPDAGTLEVLLPFDLAPGFRTNDGKVDPAGNLWWSTMDQDEGRRPGDVFRTAKTLETERMLTGIHIPNTISFSPDGRSLYMADSKLQTLFVHEMADLSKLKAFADIRGQVGAPDGSAVDAEGCLWNVQCGAGRVVRYRPDGRVDRIVPMPVERPTSCAFGGAGFSTLFVTSAQDGLSPEARARQPLAGGLFAFEAGVKGLPLPMFEG